MGGATVSITVFEAIALLVLLDVSEMSLMPREEDKKR